jgi:rare lipoprotein A
LVCTLAVDPAPQKVVVPGHADLTGLTRLGKASYYARSFAHRLMANGRRMNPEGNNAASRTLPLGTTAKVTNLKTGQSAVVAIADRGPYVDDRIVDLSPATASKIGISRNAGVAEVKVAPIEVRLPDGGVKRGTGAPQKPVCRATPS